MKSPLQDYERHIADDHIGNREQDRMGAWFASLAARADTPIDILWTGDSITERAHAGSIGTGFSDLVTAALRSRYQPAGVTGGGGYRPAFMVYNTPWIYSGTTTTPLTHGLGREAVHMAADATATLTFTGTALDVFVSRATGGGTLTVSVDGASSGTGFATITTNATAASGVATRVGGLSVGSHTVVITCSGATSILEGVMIYNGDESAGIRSWWNCHSGDTAGALAGNSSWAGAVATIQPDIIPIMLGVNDWRNGAVSSYETNLRTIINTARAACTVPPTILLIAPFLPADGTNTLSGGSGGPIQGIARAVHHIARRLPDVAVLDLFARSGGLSFRTQNRGLLNVDGIHPNAKGHRWIADSLLELLAPHPAGGQGATTTTKADVGLGNVDNTSDAAKPVSTATQAALDLKRTVTPPYLSGNYYHPVSPALVSTSALLVEGTLRLTPWPVERPVTLSRVGTEVTAVGEAGSKFRLTIYADDGYCRPGALVVDVGQIATDSAGVKELTISTTLIPGLYWIGGAIQSAPTTPPTMRTTNSAHPSVSIPFGTSLPPVNTTASGLLMTGVTGAAPGTFTGTTVSSITPRVFVKVA